ncbi:E3 ubiquitin-protein ligase TRIM39-like [Paroedura picta]|uniref:E3 ubiquitin-protein ligase TRIM39-like n=1 Tax=Paroedura picta TaxID=143630 RepID=UPI004056A310
MAAQNPDKKLWYEAACPICLGCFAEPVTLDCGHNFCQACITRRWEEPGRDATCPQCRKDVARDFKPNRCLATMVEIAKQLGLPTVRGAGPIEPECPKHHEPQHLFCKEDAISLCVICGLSEEHRNHRVIPVEEAAQEYKGELQSCLDGLRKKRENILECKVDAEKEGQDLLKHLDAEGIKAKAEFRDFCRFLERQEKFFLGQMRELQKEVKKERDANVDKLLKELSSVDSVLQEVEAEMQQPTRELLQGVRNSLERCERVFEIPTVFPPDLRQRIMKLCDISPFLTDALQHLKDSLSEFKPAKPNGRPSFGHTPRLLGRHRREVTFPAPVAQRARSESGRDPALPPFGAPGRHRQAAMASGGAVQELSEELSCPICLDFFRDPVTVGDCGHNFCRACVAGCWGDPREAPSCPLCRDPAQPEALRPNRQLANVVEIVKKIQPERGSGGEAAKGELCPKHQERLNLFCCHDASLICVVCGIAREHRAHRAIPAEEAAEEYKDVFCNCLESLKEKRQRILACKADVEKESRELLEQTGMEKKEIVAECRELHQFLEEREKRLLAQVEEVEEEIWREKDEHLERLSVELSSLENIIQEIEEKVHQPASELLQDVRSTMQRFEEKSMEKFEDPVAFPPALKWKIWDIWDLNVLLKGVVKQFKDTLISGLPLHKAKVTLNPDTAHPQLILSEDQKSLTWQRTAQDLPDNPERFASYSSALGREGFTGGRHFWEVTVGREGTWAVGVARPSVEKKKEHVCCPETGYWVIGKVDGLYLATCPLPLSSDPQRIRVSLNYVGGQVAFFDADKATLLSLYSEAFFSRETLHPYFSVIQKGYLSISP